MTAGQHEVSITVTTDPGHLIAFARIVEKHMGALADDLELLAEPQQAAAVDDQRRRLLAEPQQAPAEPEPQGAGGSRIITLSDDRGSYVTTSRELSRTITRYGTNHETLAGEVAYEYGRKDADVAELPVGDLLIMLAAKAGPSGMEAADEQRDTL